MEDSHASIWRLRLFGALEIVSPSGECVRVESRKSTELLAFLALRRSATADRDAVCDALWPDSDPLTARNRLRQTLSTLRKEARGLPLTAVGKHLLELPADQIEVDFQVVDRRLKWLAAIGGRRRQEAARQILEIIRPGLLPGLSTPWVEADRRRYGTVARQLEEELAEAEGTESGFHIGDELGGLIVPLVGRERELSAVRDWIRHGDERCLYLVGSPGVGKTRILVETLASSEGAFDAVVSLSTVQASETPWQERLGAAIGVRDQDRLTVELAKLLNDFRRPLMAIDDFDQAGPGMAEWVDQILDSTPRLRVLATARRRPEGSRTKVQEIGPLPTVRDGEKVAPALLMRFAAQAGVGPKEIRAHRQTIEELATHLKGLPLAMEVAAGWLPFMAPESLLKRLQRTPAMVVNRAAVGRGSLLECMEAICQGLAEPERQALLSLSICRGGCGEQLTEAMLGCDWPWLIRSLSDRSLASRTPGAAGVRFLVLQALRESVCNLTEPETLRGSLARHTEACFRLGAHAAREIQEGDRRTWLHWLRDEGNNVLSACERSMEDTGSAADALHLLFRLRSAFWLIGRTGEHRSVYRLALEKGDAEFVRVDADTPMAIVDMRLRALYEASKLEESAELAAACRRAREAKGDPESIAEALDYECDARRAFGDLEGALECSLRSAELDREAGNRHKALWIKSKTAGILRESGRFGEFHECRRLGFIEATEIGDYNSEGMYAKEYAKAAMLAGNWEEARRFARQSVSAFQRSGEAMTHFDALLILAGALIGGGESPAAGQALEEAQQYSPMVSDKRLDNVAYLLRCLGTPAHQATAAELVQVDRYD